MKLKQLIIVVAMVLPFTTIATEHWTVKTTKASTTKKSTLATDKKTDRQKALIKVLIVPCEPYPLCT